MQVTKITNFFCSKKLVFIKRRLLTRIIPNFGSANSSSSNSTVMAFFFISLQQVGTLGLTSFNLLRKLGLVMEIRVVALSGTFLCNFSTLYVCLHPNNWTIFSATSVHFGPALSHLSNMTRSQHRIFRPGTHSLI